MVRIILQVAALILLPILLYFLYRVILRRRAAATGKPVPELEKGHWYWVIMAAAALAIGGILAFGLTDQKQLSTADPAASPKAAPPKKNP